MRNLFQIIQDVPAKTTGESLGALNEWLKANPEVYEFPETFVMPEGAWRALHPRDLTHFGDVI